MSWAGRNDFLSRPAAWSCWSHWASADEGIVEPIAVRCSYPRGALLRKSPPCGGRIRRPGPGRGGQRAGRKSRGRRHSEAQPGAVPASSCRTWLPDLARFVSPAVLNYRDSPPGSSGNSRILRIWVMIKRSMRPARRHAGTRRGDLRIAHAHEMIMRSGSPPLIGSTMDLGCAESVALALTHANSSASSQGLNPVSCTPAA